MVTINVEKRHLYLVSAIVIFLIGVAIVISYGGSTPSAMGHTIGEVEPPAGCSDGNILKWTSSNGWICDAPSSTSYSLTCIRESSASATLDEAGGNYYESVVYCPLTHPIVMGGGCYDSTNIHSNVPNTGHSRPGDKTNLDAQAWFCVGWGSTSNIRAAAICCNFG